MTHDADFEFFVEHRRCSITFHLVTYLSIWLAKAGTGHGIGRKNDD